MSDLLAMFGAEDEEEVLDEPAPDDISGQRASLLRRLDALRKPDRLWNFSIQTQLEEAVFDMCLRKKSKVKVDLPPEVQVVDGTVDGQKVSERWAAVKELGRKVCVEEFDKIYDRFEAIVQRREEEHKQERIEIEAQLRALPQDGSG